jgi:signal peptidase II
MDKIRKQSYILGAISILLIAFDQITKMITLGANILGSGFKGIAQGEIIPFIGDFIQFTYVQNPGMAFGISFGAGKILLSLFSIVASAALVWYFIKIEKYSLGLRSAIAFIFAGAFGNLIDRVFYGLWFGSGLDKLFYGNVVDFIMVDIPDINIGPLHYSHWPVFNIADACVTLGVIILLVNYKKIPQFEDLKTKDNEISDK